MARPNKQQTPQEQSPAMLLLIDKLSELLMVEQNGRQLCRAIAARASLPAMQKSYETFGRQATRRAEALVQQIQALGGDPSHVSPTARLAQWKNTKLLESSLAIDGLSLGEIQVNDLENVLLAKTKCLACWELLTRLAASVPDAKAREALETLARESIQQETEALPWVRQTIAELTSQMATRSELAPLPERWQRVLSGPTPAIEAIHPAPLREDLLEAAKQPAWQESVGVRAMAAAR